MVIKSTTMPIKSDSTAICLSSLAGVLSLLLPLWQSCEQGESTDRPDSHPQRASVGLWWHHARIGYKTGMVDKCRRWVLYMLCGLEELDVRDGE